MDFSFVQLNTHILKYFFSYKINGNNSVRFYLFHNRHINHQI